MEAACFHSLGNPKGRTLDNFFYASLDELVEIFLKLSMKTVQVHLINWTTLTLVKKENNINFHCK